MPDRTYISADGITLRPGDTFYTSAPCRRRRSARPSANLFEDLIVDYFAGGGHGRALRDRRAA